MQPNNTYAGPPFPSLQGIAGLSPSAITPPGAYAPQGMMQQLMEHPGTLFSDVSLETIRRAQADFAEAREWQKFHTPRNLLMALVAEVGELSEVFQWKGEVSRDLPEFTHEEKIHVAEELSDVLLYLVRLSDICGVDLAAAAIDKINKNGQKYPVEVCRGSSAKYTAYLPVAAPRPEPVAAYLPAAPRPEPAAAPAPVASTSRATNPLLKEPLYESEKRKRFSQAQLELLQTIAERANWSVTNLTADDKELIYVQHGISRERLQNFFNNRKPGSLKKPKIARTSSQQQNPNTSSGTSEQQEQQAGSVLLNLRRMEDDASTRGESGGGRGAAEGVSPGAALPGGRGGLVVVVAAGRG